MLKYSKIEPDIINNEPVFTISTAAKLLEISVHTLRKYEKQGLILPFKKNSKQRLYSRSDIERIECIRKAINEQKISISGIRTIYSLIPCWSILKCNENNETCTVFTNHSLPCWAHKHINNVCTGRDCRVCEVYSNYGTCGSIKEKLKSLTTQENNK